MADGKVSLEMALVGNDSLTGTLKNASKAADSFGDKASSAARKAGSAADDAHGKLGGLGSVFEALKNPIMGWSAVAVGAIAGVMGSLKALKDHAIEGEKDFNLNNVFVSLTKNADEAMAKYREASKGLVDDTTIQQFANKYTLLGATNEDIAQTLKMAIQMQMATGDAWQGTFEQIAKASVLGKEKSIQMLGVEVDLTQATEDYALAVGKGTEELTKSEKTHARMEAIAGLLGEKLGHIPWDEMQVAMQQIDTDLVNLASSTDSWIHATITGAKGVEEAFGGIADTLDRPAFERIAKFGQMTSALNEANISDADKALTLIDSIHKSKAEVLKTMEDLAQVIEITREKAQNPDLSTKDVADLTSEIGKLEAQFRGLEGGVSAADRALTALRTGTQGMTDILGGDSGLFANLANKIKAAQPEIQKAQKSQRDLVVAGIDTELELELSRLDAEDKIEAEKAKRREEAGKKAQAAMQASLDNAERIATENIRLEFDLAKVNLDQKDRLAILDLEQTQKHAEAKAALQEILEKKVVSMAEVKAAKRKYELTQAVVDAQTQAQVENILLENEKKSAEEQANISKLELELKKTSFDETDKLSRLMIDSDMAIMAITRDLETGKITELEANLRAEIELRRFAYEEKKILADQESQLLEEYMLTLSNVDNTLQGFAGKFGATHPKLAVFAGTVGKVSGIFAKDLGNMQKAIPGAISASGDLTDSLIDNEIAVAAVRMIMELAAGTVAVFTNPAAAPAHFAAAGLYGMVAGQAAISGGGSRGKSGGGKGGSVKGGTGTQTPGYTPGGGGPSQAQSTVINVNGFVGSPVELGAKVGQNIDAARRANMASGSL